MQRITSPHTRLARGLAAPALLLALATTTSVGHSAARQVPQPPARPTCRQALDSLDSRLRQNYAGFLLEIRGVRRSAYDTMLAGARARADRAPYVSCYPVLSGYTDWFDDPHVFTFQFALADSAEVAQRRAAIRVVPLTEAIARAHFARHRRALDPIEGVWFDGPSRFAVIRDSADASGATFLGVLLASDTAPWPQGAVRATFVRNRNGSYATELVSRDFGSRSLTARLHKRTLLRLSPGMWGRVFPLLPADTGLIDTTNVRAPRVSVRQRSVVFSIPSHDPQYTSRIDSLVAAHAGDIRRTGLLIVDLRGNEGGASFATRALTPWIASRVRRPTPFDSGEAVMLSSPAQVAYARRLVGSDTSAFARRVMARLETSTGELVPITDSATPVRPDSVVPGPWRVVIMVDRGTVSAAEVLVLTGLRSDRTTVVGEPTAGALDYQSTQIVGLGIGDRRWALGYPTITAHAELPRRGMRGKGIEPHIRMDWNRIADPIAETERRFGAR